MGVPNMPVVGLTYPAKAKNWDLRQAQSKEFFVSVVFAVEIGKDEHGQPVVWEREKIISFAPNALDISLQTLEHLGFKGNPQELWGGRGKLPNTVSVTIGPGDPWKDKDGKIRPGDPQISSIRPVGAVRFGKTLTAQQALEWGAQFDQILKAKQRKGTERLGPTPHVPEGGMPEGFEDQGPPFPDPADTAGGDDDIPF